MIMRPQWRIVTHPCSADAERGSNPVAVGDAVEIASEGAVLSPISGSIPRVTDEMLSSPGDIRRE